MARRNGLVILTRQFLCSRSYTSLSRSSYSNAVVDSKTEEPVLAIEDHEERTDLVEAEIEAKRNKSRLLEKEYNILKGIAPDPDAYEFHRSLKFKRKMYGLYGSASGIDPGTLWPDRSDLDYIREYESVAHPYTIQEMVSKARQRKAEEERAVQARQKKIAENLKKVSQWMKEIEVKKEKKLKELAASKMKRDSMLEEVRKQLGYNIDVKDERFKQALLQKEKDMKKQLKEAKIKAKQARIMRSFDQEEQS